MRGPSSTSAAHGRVAAVASTARSLVLPVLLGPPCRSRDLAFALIVSRVIHPAGKLSILFRRADTTSGVDLDVASASDDED